MAKYVMTARGGRWINAKAIRELWACEEVGNYLIRGNDGFEILFKSLEAREAAMKEMVEDMGGVYAPIVELEPEPVVELVVEEVKPEPNYGIKGKKK